MPLSQYKVVCIPNTFDMLTAQKLNCDARSEDFCWEKHMIPAGYCLEISSTFLRHYLSLKESHEVYHLWFTDQGSSTDISSIMHEGGSRIKLVKPCQDLQTPLLSWSWAWPISASMVLFHWRLGIPNHWSLFDIILLLNVAFHSTTWCASWSHDSSGNPASRLVYPGYEVRTAGWHHQHIHQSGAQWHNQ